MSEHITRTLSGRHTISEVRTVLFGVLAGLAWPLVERYYSDLYHDAQWIDANVTGPCVFPYAVGEDGTHINLDTDELRGYPFTALYVVQVEQWPRGWTITAHHACRFCGEVVKWDGGAWVDRTDGDGCDNLSGAHLAYKQDKS